MTRAAIVTGGASGIGLATARRLLDAGWAVALLDANPDAIAALDGSMPADRVEARAVDVSDEAAVVEAVAAVAGRFGRVDGLLNCAGIAGDTPFLDNDLASFRRILEVNVLGTFLVSREAARQMEQGGSIVNMSSVSGLRGNAGRSAYGASKGAIVTMTQVMAVDLASRGIRVNALAPGPVETPMVKALHDAAIRREWNEMIPLARYGEAGEIAEVALFLLSERASYITGEVIAVDGGFMAAGVTRMK